MHMGSATRKPLTPTTVVIPHHQDSCHPDDKVVILTRSGRIRSWRVAHVRPTTNERVRVPQVPRFWGPGIPQTPPSQGLFPKYAPGSRIAVAPGGWPMSDQPQMSGCGCPRSLAFGDLGYHKPRPVKDYSRNTPQGPESLLRLRRPLPASSLVVIPGIFNRGMTAEVGQIRRSSALAQKVGPLSKRPGGCPNNGRRMRVSRQNPMR
jgi:hypothetical protein